MARSEPATSTTVTVAITLPVNPPWPPGGAPITSVVLAGNITLLARVKDFAWAKFAEAASGTGVGSDASGEGSEQVGSDPIEGPELGPTA